MCTIKVYAFIKVDAPNANGMANVRQNVKYLY